MSRLDKDMQEFGLGLGHGGFAFTGARLEKLGATEYTLVTVAVDTTGSVAGFEKELRGMLVSAMESCKKSPRSDNILIRVVLFATSHPQGILEIHGFKPLAEIDAAQYPQIRPAGGTPLCDAVYSALGATNTYADALRAQDYGVNGIIFVITDGMDNESVATMQMVKDEQEKVRRNEALESLVSILIGVNDAVYQNGLDKFRIEAGMTQYISVGDVMKNPRKLAKLAAFVSSSVSSQAQALGTGGPSQQIAATI